MQGIGPASASAILTAAEPSLPFMSDEALAAALGGKPVYTVKQYVQYALAMRKRAAELSTEGGLSITGQHLNSLLDQQAMMTTTTKIPPSVATARVEILYVLEF